MSYVFLQHKPNFFKKQPNLIYSSSDSSEEEKSLKLWLMCLIILSQCTYTVLKALAESHLRNYTLLESKLITAKQVWLKFTLEIFYYKKL